MDTLPDLVYSYNHTAHRSTKRKPADVMMENEKQVWHTLYGDNGEAKHPAYKFKTGGQVRISKIKRTFDKGYLPNFSKGIFTVSKQVPRDPPVYKLKDCDGEELKGTFYEKELQKVIKSDDVYEVEKIIKNAVEAETASGKSVCIPLPILTRATLYQTSRIMFTTARMADKPFGPRPL